MRFGVHVGVGKGYAKSIQEALAAGCDCIQIFAGNPRAFRIAAFDKLAWQEFRRLRREHDIEPTVIHTSYLINLATSNKALHDKSVKLVANDLAVASKAGIEYVNTHLGSYGDADRARGFNRVCSTIRSLIERAPPGPMLLLENSAGAGSLCGGTMEELGNIIRAVNSRRVGVCIDTAHAWASGYKIDTPEGVRGFLQEIRRHIGFNRVRALHINDTQVELGARRDRHWHVAEGKIGEVGFRALLGSTELFHVAAICETPKSPELDKRNVATARRLGGRGAAPASRPTTARGTKRKVIVAAPSATNRRSRR